MLTAELFFFFFPPLLSVKEKLTADPDSEIATTSLRVSLMCPVRPGVSPPLYETTICAAAAPPPVGKAALSPPRQQSCPSMP